MWTSWGYGTTVLTLCHTCGKRWGSMGHYKAFKVGSPEVYTLSCSVSSYSLLCIPPVKWGWGYASHKTVARTNRDKFVTSERVLVVWVEVSFLGFPMRRFTWGSVLSWRQPEGKWQAYSSLLKIKYTQSRENRQVLRGGTRPRSFWDWIFVAFLWAGRSW